MSPGQLLVAFAAIALEATLLAAILIRRRYATCLSFALYVTAVLVPGVLFAVWPERFYTVENYFLRETVHNLLKFAIALELGYRTFRVFPGALSVARKVALLILSLVALMAIAGISLNGPATGMAAEWHARVLNGTIWLLTGIAAVILWYRLPVAPFHKAILVGFVPYLLVFSVGMRAVVELGLQESHLFHRVHTVAYVALLFYWNRAAWAPAPMTTLAVSGAPRQFESGATVRSV